VDFSKINYFLYEEKKEDFLNSILTGDETWLPFYSPLKKSQTREWVHTNEDYQPTKVKENKFGKKIMLTVFWDNKGVLLVDYLDEKETIKTQYYIGLLDKLNKIIKITRPEKK
jgi:hypothetical protein